MFARAWGSSTTPRQQTGFTKQGARRELGVTSSITGLGPSITFGVVARAMIFETHRRSWLNKWWKDVGQEVATTWMKIGSIVGGRSFRGVERFVHRGLCGNPVANRRRRMGQEIWNWSWERGDRKSTGHRESRREPRPKVDVIKLTRRALGVCK